MEAGLIK